MPNPPPTNGFRCQEPLLNSYRPFNIRLVAATPPGVGSLVASRVLIASPSSWVWKPLPMDRFNCPLATPAVSDRDSEGCVADAIGGSRTESPWPTVKLGG